MNSVYRFTSVLCVFATSSSSIINSILKRSSFAQPIIIYEIGESAAASDPRKSRTTVETKCRPATIRQPSNFSPARKPNSSTAFKTLVRHSNKLYQSFPTPRLCHGISMYIIYIYKQEYTIHICVCACACASAFFPYRLPRVLFSYRGAGEATAKNR